MPTSIFENPSRSPVRECVQKDQHNYRRVKLLQYIRCALLRSVRSPLGNVRSPLPNVFSAGSACGPAVPYSCVKAGFKRLTASVNNAMHGGFYKAQVVERSVCARRSVNWSFHSGFKSRDRHFAEDLTDTHTQKPRHSDPGSIKEEAAIQLLQ